MTMPSSGTAIGSSGESPLPPAAQTDTGPRERTSARVSRIAVNRFFMYSFPPCVLGCFIGSNAAYTAV